ncbi:MAG: OmpA family protein [Syntrophomonas sp.]|nr:OmpA family protein [Syntrophomonas sp.]
MSKLDDTFELLEEDVPKAPKVKIPVTGLLLVLLLAGGAGAYSMYAKNRPADNNPPAIQAPVQPAPSAPAPAPAPPPPPTREVPTPVNIVINFESNSSQVIPSQMAKLQQLAVLIRDNPGKMKLSAYTDDVGDDAAGQWLSEQRAAMVVQVFKDLQVDNKIEYDIKAYGELYPIGDNATEEGRALNRRVEIYFAPTP